MGVINTIDQFWEFWQNHYQTGQMSKWNGVTSSSMQPWWSDHTRVVTSESKQVQIDALKNWTTRLKLFITITFAVIFIIIKLSPARNNISNNLKVWHTYCSSILFSFSLTVFWKSARGKLSTCIYLCNYCLPLLVQNQQISGIPGT